MICRFDRYIPGAGFINLGCVFIIVLQSAFAIIWGGGMPLHDLII